MRNTVGHRFRRKLSVPDWLEPKLTQDFADNVAAIAGEPILHIPQWEGNGLIAYDISPTGADGTIVGATLGQPGIGDGRTSYLYDGLNDLVNVATAPLAGIFNGLEGTAFTYFRVRNAAVWTDLTLRRIFWLSRNGANLMALSDTATNNQLQAVYIAGGVTETVNDVTLGGDTEFMQLAMTWSNSADEFKFYGNANQLGATQVGLGVWAGDPGLILIGSQTAGGLNLIDGYEAHTMLFDTALSQTILEELLQA